MERSRESHESQMCVIKKQMEEDKKSHKRKIDYKMAKFQVELIIPRCLSEKKATRLRKREMTQRSENEIKKRD